MGDGQVRPQFWEFPIEKLKFIDQSVFESPVAHSLPQGNEWISSSFDLPG